VAGGRKPHGDCPRPFHGGFTTSTSNEIRIAEFDWSRFTSAVTSPKELGSLAQDIKANTPGDW
jgi:hypothetical protein